MGIFLGILSVLILIILFILFVRINIDFETQYKEKDLKIKFRLYVLNQIFGKNFELSEDTDYDLAGDDPIGDEEECASEELPDDDIEETLKEALKELYRTVKRKLKKFLKSIDDLLAIQNKIRKKFVFKTLNISVDYGDGDAHTTAVATGVMWGVMYNILRFVTKITTVKNHKENINAVFGKKCLNVSVDGIFKTRLVYIIYAKVLYDTNHIKQQKNNNKSNEE